MSEHTKWKVNNWRVIEREGGQTVADLSEPLRQGLVSTEETKTRTHLIANAPETLQQRDDLLAACKELQSSAGELSGSLDDGLAEHEWGNTNRVDKAIIKAKAAIAAVK